MQCVLLSVVLASLLSATWAAPNKNASRTVTITIKVYRLNTRNYMSSSTEKDIHPQTTHFDKHSMILLDDFNIHMDELSAFTCHKPQARAVSVEQLLPGQTHYKSFIPDVTVLHACDHSCGACPSGQVCAPAHNTTIKRTFRVTFLEDFEHHYAGESIYEHYDFLEHTECSCQQKSVLADHFKHMSEVAAFTCHKPQARAVSVKQLLPGQSHYKSFIPDVTVLHVCDHSCGACPSGQVCAPAHHTAIKRTFRVTFLEDFEHYYSGDSINEHHYFLEHTECSCKQLIHHGIGSAHQ